MSESKFTIIPYICKHCRKEFPSNRKQRKRGWGYCSKACADCGRSETKGLNPERFSAKLSKAEGDGCWEWTGKVGKRGYGIVFINGKEGYAHRLAWKYEYGEIPAGIYVLHKCDNPICCRTSHLFLGTHAENMTDMGKKGRSGRRGERSPNAKLTDEIVIVIRSRYWAGGVTQRELAEEFGVSNSVIGHVTRCKGWKHVPPSKSQRKPLVAVQGPGD